MTLLQELMNYLNVVYNDWYSEDAAKDVQEIFRDYLIQNREKLKVKFPDYKEGIMDEMIKELET